MTMQAAIYGRLGKEPPARTISKEKTMATCLVDVIPGNSEQQETLMQEQPEKDLAETLARLALEPALQAATTLMQFDKGPTGNLDLEALVKALSDQTAQANSGDMSRAETMLTAQAHTLDAIFNKLAQRAINAELTNQLESFLKLALRAQSQCRATWESLATIKNPPMVGYVRKANIAHGHQQVNNAQSTASESPRARERGKIRICKTNYWRRKMANGWTLQRRAQQAVLIRRWRPWEKSTGPTSPKGKYTASRNSYKGGTRQSLREICRTLRDQQKVLKSVRAEG